MAASEWRLFRLAGIACGAFNAGQRWSTLVNVK